MKNSFFLLVFTHILFTISIVQSQVNPYQNEIFWRTDDREGITWDITGEERLPHSDNIEMSGELVSGIIQYTVEPDGDLIINRHIIFPQLRVFIPATASPWLRYRAYLQDDYDDRILPVITYGTHAFKPGPVDSVRINGVLTFYHRESAGLALKRTLLPSMTERMFLEQWELFNQTDSTINLKIGHTSLEQNQDGIYGYYTRRVYSDAEEEVTLDAGESNSFGIYMAAFLNDEDQAGTSAAGVIKDRQDYLDTIRKQLVLKTPDPVLNRLFYFSKIRAADSIFRTSMGLVQSPGGGRYYTGVWANDQAEYSGPFFPYLGYEKGNIAALNAYRVFLNHIPEGDGHFWSSFEMNGELTCCGADRGDAAMIAFGAAHFALAMGDEDIARELWPLIDWSLDYCERRKNEEGVVRSDSDEMEGRIATGNANLSTSTLYYGALQHAINLGRSIDVPPARIRMYEKRATKMANAIEEYFGATIEGLETYRYFKGSEYLRHWICLPLVMGINERKEGTLDALFSKLWTDNGVRVEYNPDQEEPDLFWDRGTLYAFRGAFKAGATDLAIEKLKAYSTTRLLGFHVPYVVEAWPEGNMAHLSAESALYCRIFTEGLLGINPISLDRFSLSPHLPAGWSEYELEHVRLFGKDISIFVLRDGEGMRVKVESQGKIVADKSIDEGMMIEIKP